MPPTSQHLAAERAFRTLLEDSALPPPDDVSFDDPDSVLFLWHDRKLAVVIELGEPPAGVPPDPRYPPGSAQRKRAAAEARDRPSKPAPLSSERAALTPSARPP